MANVLVNDSSLSAIAEAIREKNGQPNTYKPAQMAGAIAAIPVGAILPELTTPAAAGDILQGKEVVDGSGNKVTGTLQCLSNDSVELQETPVISGAEPMLEICLESSIDSSMATLSVPVPDAKPESIVAGKSILGVNGTAKTVVTASGTITLATDSRIVTITSGLPNAKEIAIFAQIADPAALTANSILKAVACKSGISEYESAEITNSALRGANHNIGSITYKISTGLSGVSATAYFNDDVITLESLSTSRLFRSGITYNWIAYGWED